MFEKITKIQLGYYEEEILHAIGKCNTIIEFCATPILCKGFNLSSDKVKKLNNIIEDLKKVSAKLDEAKKIVHSIKFD